MACSVVKYRGRSEGLLWFARKIDVRNWGPRLVTKCGGAAFRRIPHRGCRPLIGMRGYPMSALAKYLHSPISFTQALESKYQT